MQFTPKFWVSIFVVYFSVWIINTLYISKYKQPSLLSYNKTNWMQQSLKFIFGIKLYMFRTVPLSTIRSFSLYTQQWHMSYMFADSLRAGSGQMCVQWKTLDDGRRSCPKHVEFYSKNKFEKLVHLVGFIIRICFVCLWPIPQPTGRLLDLW